MKTKEKPNPGTKHAQEIGCTCPVLDNHYGKGWNGVDGVFIYNLSCPVHKSPIKEKQQTTEK